MMKFAGVVAVGVVLSGCAPTSFSARPAPIHAAPVRLYTVEIVNATIAPGNGGITAGTSWDSGAPLPVDTARKLTAALAPFRPDAAAAADAAIVLGNLVAQGVKAPDVAGNVVVTRAGMPLGAALQLPKIGNQYSPSWSPRARFSHVHLDEQTRIHVTLTDKDVMWDDPIGSIDINAQHMAAAAAKGSVHQVRVNDQHPNVLFVGINVIPES